MQLACNSSTPHALPLRLQQVTLHPNPCARGRSHPATRAACEPQPRRLWQPLAQPLAAATVPQLPEDLPHPNPSARTLTPLHGAGRVQPLAQLARRSRAAHGGHQLSLRQLRQARQAARGRHQRPEVCLRHALPSTRAVLTFACLSCDGIFLYMLPAQQALGTLCAWGTLDAVQDCSEVSSLCTADRAGTRCNPPHPWPMPRY